MKNSVTQRNLFGGETVTTLEPTKAEKWRETERKISAVYENQSDSWKREVLRYAVNVFLPGRKDSFLAETFRKAYDAYSRLSGLPVTVQPKAFAGIFHILRDEKLIEKAGVAYRENFVLATTYKSLI
ncbi:MAG: hypothetical protein LUM44_17790 [Pyrinomonadaceae bacterium]|nr:hypothetical protein [Pyrinomonadaceae bacterium]